MRKVGRKTTPAGAPPDAPTLWDDDEPTWSVPDLGEAIGLALRRSFPDELWVRGEIRNLNRGRTGMVWFDLVEPAPGADSSRPPVARLSVVMFDAARRRVNSRLQQAGGGVRMTDGTEVRIKGRVDWYTPGGRLQVQMTDIDPAFTLGRLAADRDRLLRLLDAEGLLGRQAALARPLVPLRVGLVTAGGSAAEHDVMDELRRSGLGFRVVRADARVQGAPRPGRWPGACGRSRPGASTSCCWCGAAAPPPTWPPSTARSSPGRSPGSTRRCSPASATTSTARWPTRWRTPPTRRPPPAPRRWWPTCWRSRVGWARRGRAWRRRPRGGWRPSPTGCGAAGGTWRSPPGAGWSAPSGRWRWPAPRVRRSAGGALARSSVALERTVGRVESSSRAHLRSHEAAVAVASARLVARAPRAVGVAERDLDRIAGQVRVLDPARTLARGWSITRDASGAVVRSPAAVAPGDVLSTTLASGSVQSVVTEAGGPAGPADDEPVDKEPVDDDPAEDEAEDEET